MIINGDLNNLKFGRIRVATTSNETFYGNSYDDHNILWHVIETATPGVVPKYIKLEGDGFIYLNKRIKFVVVTSALAFGDISGTSINFRAGLNGMENHFILSPIDTGKINITWAGIPSQSVEWTKLWEAIYQPGTIYTDGMWTYLDIVFCYDSSE